MAIYTGKMWRWKAMTRKSILVNPLCTALKAKSSTELEARWSSARLSELHQIVNRAPFPFRHLRSQIFKHGWNPTAPTVTHYGQTVLRAHHTLALIQVPKWELGSFENLALNNCTRCLSESGSWLLEITFLSHLPFSNLKVLWKH